MSSAWIVDAVRTPIGRYGGALASVRPDDLAALVIGAVVRRTGAPTGLIDDVVLGATNGAGEDNRNVARMGALLAGLGHGVPGTTVNRLCASGLEAVSSAARAIKVGEARLMVAGGVESMSRAPWVMLKPDHARPRGDQQMADTVIGWRFANPRMGAVASLDSMGETAENVARRYEITRADQDAFAVQSHRRALEAHEAGRWRDEILAVAAPRARAEDELVDRDEGPRTDTTRERLAQLRPAFRKGGSVTAGNSSSINDGAACLLLASDRSLADLGTSPLARVISSAAVGVDPAYMGMGPVPAMRRALEHAELRLRDIGLFELNEAFAAQAVACIRELGLDPALVNVNGGAIALGHPLGSSGARILGTLCWEMRRRHVRYGVATMCVGVGQGFAVVVENTSA